ncbi:MAG: rhamnan synthesis F family protein [Candidatus Hodarchaeales archaeon]
MQRICLFAGYDPEGIIDDYVVYYLKELSQFADIYYLADCDMDKKELEKISNFTISASAYRHNKYDFGSWAELITKIGWDEIGKYDELILANDSQFLVRDISFFLNHMENQKFDFWAGLAVDEFYLSGKIKFDEYLSSNNILENSFTFVSSFIVFSKNLFSERYIENYFNNIKKLKDRLNVSIKYEIGLSKILIRHKVNYGVFITDIYTQASIYKDSAFHFLTLGYPFIKKKVFINQYYPIIAPLERFKFIKYHCPDANIDIIRNHIQRMSEYKGEKLEDGNFGIHNKKFNIIEKLHQILLKFLTISLPNFFMKFYKYWHESQFSKNRFLFFKCFITTLPEQIKLGKALRSEKKLIIYFNIARDFISGGMLSINRFAEKTAEIGFLHDYKIVISGIPIYNPPLRYRFFFSWSPLIRLSRIIRNCNPDELIIHIPEYYAFMFYRQLNEKFKKWFVTIPKLQINILNQNDWFMPDRYIIRNYLAELTENITITTAHSNYCTQQKSNYYSAPVHQLTPFLPEFQKINYENKRKTILFSPDDNLFEAGNLTKQDIINKIEKELPDFQVLEIKDLTFEEYKALISESMFTISFGEGYDGYFLEPILSGSISFAVFNPLFFPQEFIVAKNVYFNWNDFFNNIVSDIKIYSQNKTFYESTQAKCEKLINNNISDLKSIHELENFYKGKYDFVPNKVQYSLFDDIKQMLIDKYHFRYFQGSRNNDLFFTPDGDIYLDLRGEFYHTLYEVYVQNIYEFCLDEDCILIDIGFHAGTASTYLLKKYGNIKHVFGYEPMLPTYNSAIKNLEYNSLQAKVTLKPIALSDEFHIRKCPYIPDWSPSMKIENFENYGILKSSSEMSDQIRNVDIEIVPANTELEKIIIYSTNKIMMKCNTNGSELKIIRNLSQNNLLHRIDLLIIITDENTHQTIINILQQNDFTIKDVIINKHQKVHSLFGIRN